MENRTIQVDSVEWEKRQPLSAWGYFGYDLLFNIPFLGWFIMLMCALFARNKNLRSFARSYYCKAIIIGFVILLLVTVFSSVAAGILTQITEILEGIELP